MVKGKLELIPWWRRREDDACRDEIATRCDCRIGCACYYALIVIWYRQDQVVALLWYVVRDAHARRHSMAAPSQDKAARCNRSSRRKEAPICYPWWATHQSQSWTAQQGGCEGTTQCTRAQDSTTGIRRDKNQPQPETMGDIDRVAPHEGEEQGTLDDGP